MSGRVVFNDWKSATSELPRTLGGRIWWDDDGRRGAR